MPTTKLPKRQNDTVQIWNGYHYNFVSRKKARELEKAGTHQIAENITAAQLKRPEDFTPPKATGVLNSKPAKGYETREMRAEPNGPT